MRASGETVEPLARLGGTLHAFGASERAEPLRRTMSGEPTQESSQALDIEAVDAALERLVGRSTARILRGLMSRDPENKRRRLPEVLLENLDRFDPLLAREVRALADSLESRESSEENEG
jgi:phage terminase Nu1 subunit (DNA packaging protein)